MNKNTHSTLLITLLGIITIVAAAGIIVWRNVQNGQVPPAQIPVSQNPNNQQQGIGKPGIITIDNLAQGQTITLPFTATGTVKGWFFEGSFPVFMKDSNGNQLGYGLASSSQDWMTANPIPFTVTLPAINYQGPGVLVFTKDNPSGEPQFDDSFTVNVTFQ